MRDLRVPSVTLRRIALAVAAGVVIADQFSKWLAVATLADRSVAVIPGFLWLRVQENTGAAFGLFQGRGSFLAAAAVAVTVLIVMTFRTVTRRWDAVALGLVLGGALGNLVDRMVRGDGVFDGAVVDFVYLGWFPTFNLADSAITIGAVMLVWSSLRNP